MRNPLYFFSLLMLFGYACTIKSIIIGLILLSIFLLLYIPTILNEEKVLLNEHDDDYNRYFRKTPRFFPRIRLYTKASENNQMNINIKNIDRVLIEILGFISFQAIIRFLNFMHNNGYIETYLILY